MQDITYSAGKSMRSHLPDLIKGTIAGLMISEQQDLDLESFQANAWPYRIIVSTRAY